MDKDAIKRALSKHVEEWVDRAWDGRLDQDDFAPIEIGRMTIQLEYAGDEDDGSPAFEATVEESKRVCFDDETCGEVEG